MDTQNNYLDDNSVLPLHLLNDDALEDAAVGDILHAIGQLQQRALEALGQKDGYYELAEFNQPVALDYGSQLMTDTADENAPPVPPQDFHNSLPGLLQAMTGITRWTEAIEVHLMNYSHRALQYDKVNMLGIPAEARGWKDARQMLQEKWNISSHRSKRIAERMKHLAAEPCSTPLVETEAKLPAVAEKFFNGEITVENIDTTVKLIRQLENYVRKTNGSQKDLEEVLEAFEPHIAEAAATETVPGYIRTTRRWLDQIANALDEDGPAPLDVLHRHDDSVVIHEYSDGTLKIILTTKQLNKETVLAILRPTIKREANRKKRAARNQTAQSADQPSTAEDNVVELFEDDERTLGLDDNTAVAVDEDGNETNVEHIASVDDRSYSQRVHDEFIAMLMAMFTIIDEENPLPKFRGSPAKLFLTMDLETAIKAASTSEPPPDRTGPPDQSPDELGKVPSIVKQILEETEKYTNKITEYRANGSYGGAIHPLNLRSMLCSAEIIPAILDSKSRVIELGQSKRLFSASQMQALMLRDGGCVAPGCTCSAIYTQAHHVDEWYKHRGPTNLSNAVLLCPFHHAEIHAGKYAVEFKEGLPWLIPAKWVDPEQKAVRNTIFVPNPLAA